ncbi:MAG: Cys-tRNA(Pro) deacylase [Prolixibacteraceae bacterium]
MAIKKTNAARLLDSHNIGYEMIEYEVDENDLSASTLASKLGQEAGQVFKTLVIRGNATGIFVAVIPGDTEVDLKKAAKFSGNKSTAMVHMKELLGLTGYVRGGCSPLAMKKDFPVFIHESCRNYQKIYISAGRRGLQLKLSPIDLIHCTRATVADLTETSF